MNCRRLKDQLDTLERETTDKLGQMEQYNKELKVSAERLQGGEVWVASVHYSTLISLTLLHVSPYSTILNACT